MRKCEAGAHDPTCFTAPCYSPELTATTYGYVLYHMKKNAISPIDNAMSRTKPAMKRGYDSRLKAPFAHCAKMKPNTVNVAISPPKTDTYTRNAMNLSNIWQLPT